MILTSDLIKASDDEQVVKKLYEDFQYNLKLLEERDSELERCDNTIANLNKQLEVRYQY